MGPGGPQAMDPGRSTNIHIYVGPGGPYARDPGRSTNIHIYVGPGGPQATDPGRSTNIYIYVGPEDPYARDRMVYGRQNHRMRCEWESFDGIGTFAVQTIYTLAD